MWAGERLAARVPRFSAQRRVRRGFAQARGPSQAAERRHGHIEGGANYEVYIVYYDPDDLTLKGTPPQANRARGTEVSHPEALRDTLVARQADLHIHGA